MRKAADQDGHHGARCALLKTLSQLQMHFPEDMDAPPELILQKASMTILRLH